jgi:hypothetical protein
MSWIRPHLTFANVVSVLALFVALGGTATATLLVTGNNVKNDSLTGADVRNSSLTSLDVKDRSLLARDFKAGQLPAGAQGPQGVPGVAGPKGDSGATHAVVRTSSGHGVQRTDCLGGEHATGGGGHSPDGLVVASGPAYDPKSFFAANGPPQEFAGYPAQWEARAVKVNIAPDGTIDSIDDADVTTWVVCASP